MTTLDESGTDTLREAPDDRPEALSIYDRFIAEFGDVLPFSELHGPDARFPDVLRALRDASRQRRCAASRLGPERTPGGDPPQAGRARGHVRDAGPGRGGRPGRRGQGVHAHGQRHEHGDRHGHDGRRGDGSARRGS